MREHPDLVQKYLGTVVPVTDNFFATLNSAVFSDGTFVYVPKGVRCPMELSTYFRINASETGQFERTLIVADEGSYVTYLEGCTAPKRDENQLHAAVVELVALDDAEIKYSTVQNWYPGDENGMGGIYNFVTKRGDCRGDRSKISWTQVETGSAITWKYPSCILRGDDTVGEFYSIAIANQLPAGRYRHQDDPSGQEHALAASSPRASAPARRRTPIAAWSACIRKAENARNYTQCDSLLIGGKCGAHTVPYIESRNPTARIEHEATTSKIADDQLFYCLQRGTRPGRSGGADRQRLLQGSAAAAADGIRGRGAEAGRHLAGRQCRIVMLEIKNLHVSVGGKEILKGLTLSHRRRRGACHHGAERLGQIDAVLCAGGPRRL